MHISISFWLGKRIELDLGRQMAKRVLGTGNVVKLHMSFVSEGIEKIYVRLLQFSSLMISY